MTTPADELAVLAPLATLIEKTIRDTPIRMGPGGTDDLTAQLTVKTCVWVGKNVLPRTEGLAVFIADVDTERQRQLAKWGDQEHPNGTGITEAQQELADHARTACQQAFAEGRGSWAHVLMEEVREALAEKDPAALRAELVQCAAVIQAWIHDLDRPAASPAP
jgi:hypothetical protein